MKEFLVMFSPTEDDDVGCKSLYLVSHPKQRTEKQFHRSWDASLNKVKSTVEEWNFEDIIKNMQNKGWNFVDKPFTYTDY